ncbi:hypothetical protein D3C80_1897840 [compost metagenome]
MAHRNDGRGTDNDNCIHNTVTKQWNHDKGFPKISRMNIGYIQGLNLLLQKPNKLRVVIK